MLRLVRSCFGCITREEPTATCRLPGCALPRFREPSGRAHDFCGRTHADEFHNNQHPARDAACTPANPAPFDATLEYNTPEMLLFWQPPSVFSQWTPSHFVIGGVHYTCAEQFMMAEKARLFGDERALHNIMTTDNPRMHKELGRGVRGYDEAEWNRARTTIVTRATYAKFKQNLHMGRHLLDTREKLLAEASPHDNVWGIGLRADDPAAQNQAMWCGQNLLGNALQEVRTRIYMESLEPSG